MRAQANRRNAPAGRCGQSIDQLFYVVSMHQDDDSTVLAVLESTDVLRVFELDVLSRSFFSRDAAERELAQLRRGAAPVRAAAVLEHAV